MPSTCHRRRADPDRYRRVADPWIEGFTAARKGIAPSGNPYAIDSDFARLWSNGWYEATETARPVTGEVRLSVEGHRSIGRRLHPTITSSAASAGCRR